MRQYWQHYYHGMVAVVFILDSSCSDEELDVALDCLKRALEHPELIAKPCLLLASYQDRPDARTEKQVGSIGHCVCDSV